MDLAKIKEKIKALREKTTKNGCTEAEAKAAADKVVELLQLYDLAAEDVDIEEVVMQGGSKRGTVRERLYVVLANCLNCEMMYRVSVFGDVTTRFYGYGPNPEIAAYLKDRLDRAIDYEVRQFKKTNFYKRKRKLSVKRQCVQEFTHAMCNRLILTVRQKFMQFEDPETSKAVTEWFENNFQTESLKTPEISTNHWMAHQAGYEAGEGVELHDGVNGSTKPLEIGG